LGGSVYVYSIQKKNDHKWQKAGVGSLLSQLQNNMSLIIFALLLYISTLQNHLSHSKIWMALKIVVPLQWILEQNLLQKK
jgi:hypothetical protein